MMWLMIILTAVGTSIITCVLMEAYYQRRASEAMGEYETGLEAGFSDRTHRAA